MATNGSTADKSGGTNHASMMADLENTLHGRTLLLDCPKCEDGELRITREKLYALGVGATMIACEGCQISTTLTHEEIYQAAQEAPA